MVSNYLLANEVEIDRLERQAALIGHDRVLDHVQLPAGTTMLDAGSGSGWASRLVAGANPGVAVTGIDVTPDFVSYATRRCRDEGLTNLDHLVGDIADLPFEDGSFDLVRSQLVLFFLPEPERAVSEFARVARPGGQVTIAVTDCPFQWISPERPALSAGIAAFRDAAIHGWRTPRLPGMMRASGLEDVRVEIVSDRVHTFIGRAGTDQRRNIEESYGLGLRALAEAVGGPEAAERLLAELLDFVDDEDSSAFCTHWIVTARKRAS